MGLFSKKSCIGVDLGHERIKVMQLERAGDTWKVAKVVTTATPEEAIKDGVVVEPSLLGLVLRQLLKDNHITATDAAIAVSGASVIVRHVRVPKMPEAVLRKSMKFEAGRYVPTSTEDSFVEFEILGDAEENQMDILVVAAPKDTVESRIQTCEEAGLEVEIVDIEALAAYRSLVEADPRHDWSERTIALIDIGATTTNVSVISHGDFAMSRTIPNGGKVMTDALKNYFKISDEDAEAGKAQLDFRELVSDEKPKENPPLRVLQPHVDDLVREIRRSLNYYQSQQAEGSHNTPADAILVTGGGAKLSGLAEYMAHKLGIETTPLDIYTNPRFEHDSQVSGMELSIVAGLAMRAYGRAA